MPVTNSLPPESPPVRQLRSRPIDIFKKLYIIRSVDDLMKLASEEHNIRVDPSTLGFRPDGSFVVDETKENNYQKYKNIVVPPIQTVDPPTLQSQKFEKPDHYIRYETRKDHVSGIYLEDGSLIHFDILREDEEFLDNLNKRAGASSAKPILSETNFCKLIDRFEKATGRWGESPGEISFDEALKIKKDLFIEVPSHIVKEVYNHWKHRRNVLGKPLLRMFWPQTNLNDISPFAVFRPRTKDKMTLRRPKRNQAEIVHKMEQLLEDFKRVEKILKKMKQRDEKKLLLLELSDLIFEQMRHEVNDPTYKVPQWEFLKETKFDKSARKMKKAKEKKMMEVLQTIGVAYPSPIAHKKALRQVCQWPLASPSFSALESPPSFHRRPQNFSPLPYTSFPFPPLKTETYFPPAYVQATPAATAALSPHVDKILPLQIMRRRGRGGRIWLDRKREMLPSMQEALPGPPPIASNLDSFDIYAKSNPFNRQRIEVKLLNSIALGEDSNFSPFSPPFSSFSSSNEMAVDEDFNKRTQREAMDSYNNFRAWIKCTLPSNPTHVNQEGRLSSGVQRSGLSFAKNASTSAAMRSGGDVSAVALQPPYAYSLPSSGFSHA